MDNPTSPMTAAELRRLREACPKPKFTLASFDEEHFTSDGWSEEQAQYLAAAANHAIAIISELESQIADKDQLIKELKEYCPADSYLEQLVEVKLKLAEKDQIIEALKIVRDNANACLNARVELDEALRAELSRQDAELSAARAECADLAELRWRPISEIHEDHGPCVLIHIDDLGHQEVGSNLDIDFDESRWTHFAKLPRLGQEEYERMQEDVLKLKRKGESHEQRRN